MFDDDDGLVSTDSISPNSVVVLVLSVGIRDIIQPEKFTLVIFEVPGEDR